MNYGYIYKTINLKNKKIYVGQKSGNFRQDYLGSGVLIKKAINKYGDKNFKVEIITYAKDRKKLDKLERFYIAKYRELFPEKVYNLLDGGLSGYNLPGKIRKIISKNAKLRVGKKNAFFGKHHSLDTRNRMSEAHKLLVGDKHPHYGKKFSKQWRENISKSLKGIGHPHTEEEKRKIGKASRKWHSEHIQFHTESAKKLMSKMRRGKKHWHYGKHWSLTTRKKISESRKRWFKLQ